MSRGRTGSSHLSTRCIVALRFFAVADTDSSSSITKAQMTGATLVGPLGDELMVLVQKSAVTPKKSSPR